MSYEWYDFQTVTTLISPSKEDFYPLLFAVGVLLLSVVFLYLFFTCILIHIN